MVIMWLSSPVLKEDNSVLYYKQGIVEVWKYMPNFYRLMMKLYINTWLTGLVQVIELAHSF